VGWGTARNISESRAERTLEVEDIDRLQLLLLRGLHIYPSTEHSYNPTALSTDRSQSINQEL